MVGCLRDEEQRVEHLNLVLRAIRGVNQLAVREKNRNMLLKRACEIFIETRGYHDSWITLLGESGGLVTTAEAGLGEDLLPLREQWESGQLTICGQKALSQPDVVTIDDPPSACADCFLAGVYTGRVSAAVRLEHAGKVYGLLSVSTTARLMTDEEEVGLLREVARDIAFALRNIEVEEERKRAEKELKATQDQLLQVQKLECIGRLAGGIAHDFNNLLTTIGGFGNLLMMDMRQDVPHR